MSFGEFCEITLAILESKFHRQPLALPLPEREKTLNKLFQAYYQEIRSSVPPQFKGRAFSTAIEINTEIYNESDGR